MAPRISVSPITMPRSSFVADLRLEGEAANPGEAGRDAGTFGSTYPDSYWVAPPDDVLAQARGSVRRCRAAPDPYTPLDK